MSTAADEIQESEVAPADQVEDETTETPEPEPEREADDVDGPADDDVEPDEPEAEYEAPEPQGPSQKEIDAKTAKLERASKTYLNKVADILGDDLSDFVPSPLSTPFLFGFVFNPSMVELDESVVNATKALIGDPVPPPLVQAKDAQQCPDCEGWGQQLTGSKVHPYNVERCNTCKGRGWVGERANIAPAEVAQLHSVIADRSGEPAEPAPDEDAWGTPRNHPDYGKSPQYRDPNWAAALEAYKRGEPAPVG